MQKKLVDLEKYEFVIDINSIKDYSKSKKIFLNKPAADALVFAKKNFPKGYNLKIKDGNRTLAIQKKIVEMMKKYLKKKDPDNWLELLSKYSGGYDGLKSEETYSLDHRSGNAVDLTLVKNGQELNMGGVNHDKRDELNFFERKRKLTEEDKKIRDNRRLLKKVMKKAGFENYPPEWWHWGYKNQND